MKINAPTLILNDEYNSWDEWLEQTELKLKELGYRKFDQKHKREDFAYWKKFTIDDKLVYQIGILFYDFRKYNGLDANRIGILYQCMVLGVEGRVDLSISKNITLTEFENISKSFYNNIKQHFV